MKPFEKEEAGYPRRVQGVSIKVEEDSACYKINVELFRLCRICGLLHNHHVVSVYDDLGVELQLEEKINNYLPITVTMDDELPLHVCYPCIGKLNVTHELIVSCLDANDRFSNYLQSKDVNDLMPDTGPFVDGEELSETQSLPTMEPAVFSFRQELAESGLTEDVAELKPEEVQEVSEEIPKLKKVVVYSKNKNLSPSERVEKALEYIETKKRSLGVPGYSNSNKTLQRASEPLLYGANNTSTAANSISCPVIKLIRDTFPEQSVDFSSKTETSKVCNSSSNIVECSVNDSDVDVYASIKVLQQAVSETVAKSCSNSIFSHCNEEVSQVSTTESNGTSSQGADKIHNACKETKMDTDLTPVRQAKALDYLKSKKTMLGMANSSSSDEIIVLQPSPSQVGYTSKTDADDYCSSLTNTTCPEQSVHIHPKIDMCKVQDMNSGLMKCFPNNTDVEMDTSDEILQQAGSKFIARSSSNLTFSHCNTETSRVSNAEPNGLSFQRTSDVYGASNGTEINSMLEVASIPGFCAMISKGQIVTSESPRLESQISKVLDPVDCGKKIIVEAVQKIVSNGNENFDQPQTKNNVSCNSCGNALSFNEDMDSHVCSKNLKHGPVDFTCKICNKKFKDIYKYTIHKQIHFKGSSFKCHTCSEQFARKYSLQLHLMSHTNVKRHQCKYCDRNFLHRGSLEIHQASEHSDEKAWLCHQCGETFAHKYSLRIHTRSHEVESSKKLYICKLCSKSFRNSFILNKHLKSHTDEQKFHCSQCTKCFVTEEGLKKHEVTHLGPRPYQCSICLVTFNRKFNLTKHYKTHATEKIVTCRICRATFPSVAGLLNHRKTHTTEELSRAKSQIKVDGEKAMPPVESYQCSTCFKFLSSKLSLNLHMRVHTGEKPYQCLICSKRFTQKPALAYHTRLHTGERPHTCRFCGKGFNSKVGKESHERIHTGERPYTCGQCGAGFRCSANLRQHSWIHSEERPFACGVCNKLFRRREALQVHMRIHTGERPYSCPVCGRSFTQKGDMLKHTRSHEKKNETTTRLVCQSCGQVFTQKKYYNIHVDMCNMETQNMAFGEEVFIPVQEEMVPLKEEVVDVKNEELHEISHMTLTSDDIIITLPEITIVTDDIQEYTVQYE